MVSIDVGESVRELHIYKFKTTKKLKLTIGTETTAQQKY